MAETDIPENLVIVKRNGFLSFEYSGVFSVENAKECVNVIVQTCAAHGCQLALFDCRSMSGAMSIMNRFDVANHAHVLRDAGIRMAMIATPQQIGGAISFAETVARNRGVDIRVFTDVAPAMVWLES
jgi:hypothetical protein